MLHCITDVAVVNRFQLTVASQTSDETVQQYRKTNKNSPFVGRVSILVKWLGNNGELGY